jgi:hypothetical protein
MSLKTIAFKTALLGGLVLSSVAFEPAFASSEEPQSENGLSEDEMMHHECGEAPMIEPEGDEMGLEGWEIDPFDDGTLEPDNIELVIEVSGDTYTQVVYFAPDSADLSEPAQMILEEIASDLQAQDLAFILVTEGSYEADGLQAARVTQVTSALDQAGLPSSWVQIDQPIVVAGL